MGGFALRGWVRAEQLFPFPYLCGTVHKMVGNKCLSNCNDSIKYVNMGYMKKIFLSQLSHYQNRN